MNVFKNSIIYAIKTISNVFVPLLTIPYVSRVLLVEDVGVYNFSYNYITYFLLIANLGITSYSVREAAKIKDNPLKLDTFFNSIFTINMISMFVSLFLLFISLVIPALEIYKKTIMVMSFLILSSVGSEWLFIVCDKYRYIAYRSLLLNSLNVFLIFVLVKNSDDYEKYVLINVITLLMINVLNFVYSEKMIHHKILLSKDLLNHLKPIIIIFGLSIASQVYLNIDTTMLGFINGPKEVGIYSLSSKIYNTVRLVLCVFITVLLPKISASKSDGSDRYRTQSYEYFYMFLPVVLLFGIIGFYTSNSIVSIIGSIKYTESIVPLKILSCALFFSVLGSYIANIILLIHNLETKILFATIVGAIVNVVGNAILLTQYSYIGAAITTLISEGIVFFIQMYYSYTLVPFPNLVKNITKLVLPTLCVTFLFSLIMKCIASDLVILFIGILASPILFFIVLKLEKYDYLKDIRS